MKLAEFSTGELREHELQRAIDSVWQTLLADPKSRAEIAAEFDVPPEQLGNGLKAPVHFSTRRAHMTGGELTLIVAAWAVKDVFLGAISDELKGKLRRLVEKRLLPAVRRRPGCRNAVGPMTPSQDGSDHA